MYEPYVCKLDAETSATLKIYLFKDVQNVEKIRSNVMSGNWKCALIKPSLIIDVFQVAVAANKAALAEKTKSLITRTVYSEILFNLSLSKNISQSMSKFGVIKDHHQDQSLMVCFMVTSDSDESETIIKQIKGKLCPLTELGNFTNMQELKSTYKLDNIKSDVNLLDIIISKMVTKSFITH